MKNFELLKISDSTVYRLSKYYRTLVYLLSRGAKTVSSEFLAEQNGIIAAQVRKDLSYFGNFGKRGIGYNVLELKRSVAKILGLERMWTVALVGVGNIGRALLDYDQFRLQGFNIIMAFDNDPLKIGREFHKVFVRDISNLEDDVRNSQIEIGIVAVPASAAQAVVDKLVAGGVKGILNFAPITLKVPKGVFIKCENMAMEIEALAFAITNPSMVRYNRC